MHASVIINAQAGNLPGAGNGSPFAPDPVRRAFADAGITIDLQLCEPDRLAGCIRALIGSNRVGAIVVGGGDGTLSSAAGELAGTEVPLGVLPLGTLNHFAKDLRIPTTPADCARLVATATPTGVDVAEVNGRIFINNCSIGAYPEAIRRRDALRRLRGLGKWRAMLSASLEVLRRLRRLRVEIETGDEWLARRTPFVLVSNNRYSGRILSRQLRPRMDEGVLCSYTTRAARIAPLLGLAWRSLTTGLDAVDGLETHVARELSVNFGPAATPVAADGEVFKESPPLRFRILPGALRVFAPPPASS